MQYVISLSTSSITKQHARNIQVKHLVPPSFWFSKMGIKNKRYKNYKPKRSLSEDDSDYTPKNESRKKKRSKKQAEISDSDSESRNKNKKRKLNQSYSEDESSNNSNSQTNTSSQTSLAEFYAGAMSVVKMDTISSVDLQLVSKKYPEYFYDGCTVMVSDVFKLLGEAAAALTCSECENHEETAENHVCPRKELEVNKAVFRGQCTICQSPAGSSDGSFNSVIVTGCHHVFCVSCLITGIASSGNQQPTCPNCRAVIPVNPSMTNQATTIISQAQSLREFGELNEGPRLQLQFASSQSE